MRVLVTGGAGFIGSHLCDALTERGHETWCVDNFWLGTRRNIEHLEASPLFHFRELDVADGGALAGLFAETGFDGVFHLAANSDIRAGLDDDQLDLRLNFQTTFELLRRMKESGTRRLFFASSSAVFGETDDPLHEAYGPLRPISLYGASKLAAEAFISVHAHTHGISSLVLRFPNVVGERATHGVLYDFIGKLKATPERLEVLGDGRQAKPYLYVGDLIEVILRLWDLKGGAHQVYHAAGEGRTLVSEIAEIVRASFGNADSQITYQGGARGWPGDVPRFSYDTAKLSALGWKPGLSSTEAVRHAVRRIAENGF